eukprot:4309-Chlamydomonas_euryale.AAC.1
MHFPPPCTERPNKRPCMRDTPASIGCSHYRHSFRSSPSSYAPYPALPRSFVFLLWGFALFRYVQQHTLWRFGSPNGMSASKIVAACMGLGCMGVGARTTAPTGRWSRAWITRTQLIVVVGAASSRARAWRCVAAFQATAAVPATTRFQQQRQCLPLPGRPAS